MGLDGATHLPRPEGALAVAQRVNKKHRVKAIHAKLANRRKDALHQLSARLVQQHRAIFFSNVTPPAWQRYG
jgi:hypothetical protein